MKTLPLDSGARGRRAVVRPRRGPGRGREPRGRAVLGLGAALVVAGALLVWIEYPTRRDADQPSRRVSHEHAAVASALRHGSSAH